MCTHQNELQSGTKPIRMPPYRVNPQKAASILKELDDMKDLGVIEERTSFWSSPVVIVPKPDGTVHFCCAFRRINAVTVPNPFPLARIDDLIDCVGQAKFLMKLSRG